MTFEKVWLVKFRGSSSLVFPPSLEFTFFSSIMAVTETTTESKCKALLCLLSGGGIDPTMLFTVYNSLYSAHSYPIPRHVQTTSISDDLLPVIQRLLNDLQPIQAFGLLWTHFFVTVDVYMTRPTTDLMFSHIHEWITAPDGPHEDLLAMTYKTALRATKTSKRKPVSAESSSSSATQSVTNRPRAINLTMSPLPTTPATTTTARASISEPTMYSSLFVVQ